MSYLIFADSHVGVHQDSDAWLDIAIKLFQSIADTCIKRNITKIIGLGDFFDERKYLNIKTLNVATRISEILQQFEVYLIIGNHDTFFKDRISPSSLQMFWASQNITVIDKPFEMDEMLLLPWGCNPKEHRLSKYDCVMGHFAINGFQTNDFYTYFSENSPDIDE